DLDERLEPGLRRIDAQRVRDVRAAVEIVDVEGLHLGDAGLDQLLDACGRQDLVRLGEDLARLGVDHIVRENLSVDVLARHAQPRDACVLELADMTRGDAPALLDDDLIADADLERRRLAAQALRHEMQRDLIASQKEGVRVEEGREDLLLAHPSARRMIVTGSLRRRSMRANTQSFGSNSKSSQEPRYGMIRAEKRSFPEECVLPRS